MNDTLATFFDIVLAVFYTWLFWRGWRALLAYLEPRKVPAPQAAGPAPASLTAQLNSLASACQGEDLRTEQPAATLVTK